MASRFRKDHRVPRTVLIEPFDLAMHGTEERQIMLQNRFALWLRGLGGFTPAAIGHGARVRTSARVEQVRVDGRRATGVSGRVVEPFTGRAGHRFRIDARAVVLAAGCMATPVLLKRSGDLANGSRQVGENLQFHPGVAAMGVFPQETHPQFGATQGR